MISELQPEQRLIDGSATNVMPNGYSLTAPMANSYRDHPAFKCNVRSWMVPEEDVAEFNRTVAAVRQMGAALNGKSFSAVRRDCVQALEVVFQCLHVQCADEFEICFLAELKSECTRLMDEELAWYVKRVRSRFVRFDNESVRQDAIRMQNDRHYFGRLSAGAVEELRNLATKELARFHANVAAGRLKREDLSINSGKTVRAMRRVLNRDFDSLGVLDTVSAYTHRRTRVTGLALELSVPQATWWRNAIDGLRRAPLTLYAHIDETISCPKSIVYLTDVGEQNGPTSCYPRAYEAMQLNPLQEMIGRVVGSVGSRSNSPLRGYYAKQYHQSMSSEQFRRHFMRLPESLRFNSHMGWDVMPDSELETMLVACERKMTGPAGTFIVFDGARLLHRGGLIQDGQRVALQVIFSDMTIAQRVASRAKRMFS